MASAGCRTFIWESMAWSMVPTATGAPITRRVEPMAHALPLHNVLRDDVVQPSLSLDQVLGNAPETDGAFFKVPKVIGAAEDSAG